MIAVIKTGGKQYVVQPGSKIKIEKIEGDVGKEVTLADILLCDNDGKLQIGNPIVKDAEVTVKILKQDKHEKVIVFKYKPKKRYKRKIGHRQPFTEIEVVSISNSKK